MGGFIVLSAGFSDHDIAIPWDDRTWVFCVYWAGVGYYSGMFGLCGVVRCVRFILLFSEAQLLASTLDLVCEQAWVFCQAWEVLRQVVPYNLYDFQQTRHAIEWTDSHYPPMCFYVSNCCASETMVSVDLIPNADFRAFSTLPPL